MITIVKSKPWFRGLTVMTADSDSASEGSTPSETYFLEPQKNSFLNQVMVVNRSGCYKDLCIELKAVVRSVLVSMAVLYINLLCYLQAVIPFRDVR